MAQLLPSYFHIANTLNPLHSHNHKPNKFGSSLIHNGSDQKNKSQERKGHAGWRVVQCCTTSSIHSSSSSLSTVSSKEAFERWSDTENKVESEYLVTEFGWRVRRLDETSFEMKEVAQIQAEAFHTPMALFDDMYFDFFKAEVLSGLLYKLRNSPPDRYACLVAECATGSVDAQGKLVGIIDVTILRDEEVLQYLSGAEEYLYISGIAVSEKYRRQKVGSVLLKACDMLSAIWGFRFLALRAYEDDASARKLYSKAGYRVVSSDPLWMNWIGRRRRVLMVKSSNSLTQ